MTLVACPECSRQISDQAVACFTCGFPVAAHFRRLREEEEMRLEEQRQAEIAERQQTIKAVVYAIAFIALLYILQASHLIK